MAPILLFLNKYWKYLAAILLVLMVFGYWKSLTTKIAKQEKQIIELQVDLRTSEANFIGCQESNTRFTTLVEEQNQEIVRQAELNKSVMARYNELAKRFSNLREENKKLKKKIDEIPWHTLTCPEQVNACYEALIGTP